MTEIQLVGAWLGHKVSPRLQRLQQMPRLQRLQRRDGAGRVEDRGDIVQTVIIVGLFAAAAIIIVGILVAKATSAANGVQTQ